MQGTHLRHGGVFLAALLRLARRGVIDLRAYLTGNREVCPLPVTLTDAQIGAAWPHAGCESVAATLEAVRADVEASHATIVYTDANLTDGSVDAARWRARGADVIGACVVPSDTSHATAARLVHDMRRHFGYHVTAPTGEQLAVKLAAALGERARR